jgi:hypothetical protein
LKRAVFLCFRCTPIALVTILSVAYITHADDTSSELRFTPRDALEAHGLSIFLFHNSYHAVFGDEKMSGLEIIVHDPESNQWRRATFFHSRTVGTDPLV